MAKSTAADATPAKSPEDSLNLAAQAIAAITGCGAIAARRRAEQLPEKARDQVADLERSGKRAKIPPVLNSVPQSTPAQPPAKSK